MEAHPGGHAEFVSDNGSWTTKLPLRISLVEADPRAVVRTTVHLRHDGLDRRVESSWSPADKPGVKLGEGGLPFELRDDNDLVLSLSLGKPDQIPDEFAGEIRIEFGSFREMKLALSFNSSSRVRSEGGVAQFQLRSVNSLTKAMFVNLAFFMLPLAIFQMFEVKPEDVEGFDKLYVPQLNPFSFYFGLVTGFFLIQPQALKQLFSSKGILSFKHYPLLYLDRSLISMLQSRYAAGILVGLNLAVLSLCFLDYPVKLAPLDAPAKYLRVEEDGGTVLVDNKKLVAKPFLPFIEARCSQKGTEKIGGLQSRVIGWPGRQVSPEFSKWTISALPSFFLRDNESRVLDGLSVCSGRASPLLPAPAAALRNWVSGNTPDSGYRVERSKDQVSITQDISTNDLLDWVRTAATTNDQTDEGIREALSKLAGGRTVTSAQCVEAISRLETIAKEPDPILRSIALTATALARHRRSAPSPQLSSPLFKLGKTLLAQACTEEDCKQVGRYLFLVESLPENQDKPQAEIHAAIEETHSAWVAIGYLEECMKAPECLDANDTARSTWVGRVRSWEMRPQVRKAFEHVAKIAGGPPPAAESELQTGDQRTPPESAPDGENSKPAT